MVSEINRHRRTRGAGLAQWAERPTPDQVMVSGRDLTVPGWGPTSGSVLTVQILEAASDSVSPSLTLPLPHSCSDSLSLKNE